MTVTTDRQLTGPGNSVELALAAIAATDSRVILVNGYYAPTMRSFFCSALRRGLVGRGYVYVIPGWYSSGWWKRTTADRHDCTDVDLMQATQGYMAVNRATLAAGDVTLRQPGKLLFTGENVSAWVDGARRREPHIILAEGADFGIGIYHAVSEFPLYTVGYR